MNDYELVAILNPEIQDEDVTDTVDRIHQFITNRGGEVQNVDHWGRRRLAYPIARQFEGTYVVTHLRLPPASAAELEANLRISEDVLRHLLVRYSPAEQAAAIAASQRRRPRPMSEEQQGEPGAPADEAAAAAVTAPETGTAEPPAAAEPEAAVAEPAGAPEPATAEAPAEATVLAEPEAAAAVAPEAEPEAEAAPQAESTEQPAPERPRRTRKPAEEAE